MTVWKSAFYVLACICVNEVFKETRNALHTGREDGRIKIWALENDYIWTSYLINVFILI